MIPLLRVAPAFQHPYPIHDTYSVTFDTRKAWGSGESTSTLQCKVEILRGKKKKMGDGCCWLPENWQMQLTQAKEAGIQASPQLPQPNPDHHLVLTQK